MPKEVSKSQFKPKAFEYFRYVEETGDEVVVTDHGRPVVKISPAAAPDEAILQQLRGMVKRYDAPTEPIEAQWEAQR